MSINGGVDKTVVHIYNGILLSHNKNEIMPFAATWMDLEVIIQSEVNQKNKYHISLMWKPKKKKKIQINLFTKQKQTHRHRKEIYGYQRGKRLGEG